MNKQQPDALRLAEMLAGATKTPLDVRLFTIEDCRDMFTNASVSWNLLNASVLKKLVGYHCGHTITTIMRELKLIGKTGVPTQQGIQLVRDAFSEQMKVGG